MVRRLAATALASCALAAGAPAPIAPGQPRGSPERAALAGVNAFRAENGLPPLRASRSLTRSSRRFARHLARSGHPHHGDLREDARRYPRVGELIEWHEGRARPAAAVAAWRRSPEHRRLLLDPAFRRLGLGRAAGRVDGRRCTVWVARLGGR